MEGRAKKLASGNTRANQVYAAMKSDIVSLKLKPGALIQEETLADNYGVSRTPVREALRRLEQDGYIKTLPKKGVLVADITATDVLEVFQVRMAVEPLAARLAAGLIPQEEIRHLRELHTPPSEYISGYSSGYRELHNSIAEHCGNRRLAAIVYSLMDETTRILGMGNPQILLTNYQEHLGIIEALEKRDGLGAEQAMQEHLLGFRRSFISRLSDS